jgi:hypothetical protein
MAPVQKSETKYLWCAQQKTRKKFPPWGGCAWCLCLFLFFRLQMGHGCGVTVRVRALSAAKMLNLQSYDWKKYGL